MLIAEEEVKAQRRQREAAARRLARMNETDEERAERRRKTAEARRRSLSTTYSDADGSSVTGSMSHDAGGMEDGVQLLEHGSDTMASDPYYEAGHEDGSSMNPDSEAVRQQIFRKKFRPHDIILQSNAAGDAGQQMMTGDDSSDDEQDHMIMIMPQAAAAAATTANDSSRGEHEGEPKPKKRAGGRKK